MARMRWTYGWRATAALVCACSLSACQLSGGGSLPVEAKNKQDLRALQSQQSTSIPEFMDGPPAPAAGSPYHNQPVPPPAVERESDAAPHDTKVHQAIYPPGDSTPTPEATPPAPEPPKHSYLLPDPTADPNPMPQVINLQPDHPPPPDAPVLRAFRCFMDKKPAEAITLLRTYDKPNQELLLCLLPLAADLAEKGLDKRRPEEFTQFLNQLNSVEVPLSRRAELVIDKMAYCEKIGGFGNYSPRKDRPFLAPLGDQLGELVQVYVELSNLSTVAKGEVFETRIASTVAIRPRAGKTAVWYRDVGDRDQAILSRTVPRDFSKRYSFYVPSNLPPGEYTLTLTVTDVPTGRRAEKSLPFRVSSPPGRDT